MRYRALWASLLAMWLTCLTVGQAAADPPTPNGPVPYRPGAATPVVVQPALHDVPRPARAAGGKQGSPRARQATGLAFTALPSVVDAGRPVTFAITTTNVSAQPQAYQLYVPLPPALDIVPGSIVGGAYSPDKRTVHANFSLQGAGEVFSFLDSLAGQTPALPFIDLPAVTGVAPLPQGTEGDEVGINIGLAADVPLFNYLGQSYGTFGLVSNGYVVPGGVTQTDITYLNRLLPDAQPPNPTLAPLWTDLDLGAGNAGHGEWYADVLTGGVFGAQHALVIQWQAAQAYGRPGTRYDFEAILILETGDVYYVYEWVSEPLDAATVGAESPDGGAGTSWYFNAAPPDHLPRAGQTLRLQVSLGGGGQNRFVVRFQARPMAGGIFPVPATLVRASDGARTEASVVVMAIPPAPVDVTVSGSQDLSGYARPLLPKDVVRPDLIYAGLDAPRELAYYGLFQLPSVPLPEGAAVTGISMELTGADAAYLDLRSGASWSLSLLEPSVGDGLWAMNWYEAATAPVAVRLRSVVTDAEVGVDVVNRFEVAQADMARFAAALRRPLSLRVDGDAASPWRGIFGWDGGAGGHPPRLHVRYVPPVVELP